MADQDPMKEHYKQADNPEENIALIREGIDALMHGIHQLFMSTAMSAEEYNTLMEYPKLYTKRYRDAQAALKDS